MLQGVKTTGERIGIWNILKLSSIKKTAGTYAPRATLLTRWFTIQNF